MTLAQTTTIGIVGKGQLGRMLAQAAQKLGAKAIVFGPEPTGSPAGQVANVEITAEYQDIEALAAFARQVDVITFEFENIPVETLQRIQSITPVYPSPEILHVAQNRLREKTTLQNLGFALTPFQDIQTKADLLEFGQKNGFPFVIKTAGSGYDGKGQSKINSESDIETIWPHYEGVETIAEQWVPFQAEISVIVARSKTAETEVFTPTENHHENHILATSRVPADISPTIAQKATEIAQQVAQKLDLIGLLCIEFFITKDGGLLINEIAPRPHNSGHWTIEGAKTSQFEQLVRAITGLPLSSIERVQPACMMLNVLGDLWRHGEPNWKALETIPNLTCHLYGKLEARPGRKMGHITVLGDNQEELQQVLQSVKTTLNPLVSA